MDRQLARVEGQEHVVEMSVCDPADRHVTARSVHRVVRAKLETGQVLRDPGQQVSLLRGELLDISHVRVSAIPQRQNRTASWTARYRCASNYPSLPFHPSHNEKTLNILHIIRNGTVMSTSNILMRVV